MEPQKGKIEVVIFPVIGNPVVKQKEKEKNGNTNKRNQNRFPQLEQTRFSVNIGILTCYVIDCNPERRNESEGKIKVTVELNGNFVAKFNWFDVNFPVNEE